MGYIIKMDSLKRLIATHKENLHKGENLVDELSFLIPYMYGDHDLREFTCAMIYKDPEDNVRTEILTQDEELYKDEYIKYTLTIDSELSKYAGDVTLYLNFTKNDNSNGVIFILKTGSITIEIMNNHDFYNNIDTASLDFVTSMISQLDSKIDELNSVAEELDKVKADNIGINDDGDLQLKSNSQFIGDAVSVAIPGTEDEDDGEMDGVIDADEIYKEVLI